METLISFINPSLDDLKRNLDLAVREYDKAIMRNPINEDEIRRCVDQCVSARQQFNDANLSALPSKS